MKTKKTSLVITLALIVLAFSSSVSFSQSKSADTLKPKNSLQKGAWAVQFGIDKDFTLTNFSGASFTIKRHFSKNIALRFGVGMNLSQSDASSSSQYDTSFFMSGESGYQNNFNFNLLMLYYFNPNKEFNVYALAGPVFSYGFEKVSFNEEYSIVNQTLKNISAGGEIGFGAEYFVFRSFSLFAEYSAKVVFEQFSNYLNSINNNNNLMASNKFEASRTSFSFNNVRFGLSVYF
jgi:hypothetical protein